MKKRDLGSVVVSLLFAIVALYVWFAAGAYSEMASIFPKTFAIVLFGCSIGYVVVSRFGLVGGEAEEADACENRWLLRGVATIVILLIWCFLMRPLGFLLSGFLAYVAMVTLADPSIKITARHLAIHSVVGVVVIIGLYALFSMALGVPLPKGVLAF